MSWPNPLSEIVRSPDQRSTRSLRFEAAFIASMMAISLGHVVHDILGLGWGLAMQGLYGVLGCIFALKTLR